MLARALATRGSLSWLQFQYSVAYFAFAVGCSGKPCFCGGLAVVCSGKACFELAVGCTGTKR